MNVFLNSEKCLRNKSQGVGIRGRYRGGHPQPGYVKLIHKSRDWGGGIKDSVQGGAEEKGPPAHVHRFLPSCFCFSIPETSPLTSIHSFKNHRGPCASKQKRCPQNAQILVRGKHLKQRNIHRVFKKEAEKMRPGKGG